MKAEIMEGFATPPKADADNGSSEPSIASALHAQRPAPPALPVRLSLPWERRYHDGVVDEDKVAFVLPDVLSPAECDAVIRTCEARGFERALVNVGGGRQVLATDVRKSGRCIVDDVGAAKILWERLRHVVPGTYAETSRTGAPAGTWRCVGLNERFRVLKYAPGDYFAPHRDGHFERIWTSGGGKPGDVSFYTLIMYLNEPAKGGETNFLNDDGMRGDDGGRSHHSHRPRAGEALVFDHRVLHEGATLEEGIKYAVRTDVMYRFDFDGP